MNLKNLGSGRRPALVVILIVVGTLGAGVPSAWAALPRLEGDWPASAQERRVTLDLRAASPADALRQLADAAGWSLLMPQIAGEPVTVRLRAVPADEALAGLLAQWNLTARRTGTLVTIAPAAPGAPLAPPAPWPPAPPLSPMPPLPPSPPLPPVPPSGITFGDAPERVVLGGNAVVREGERVSRVAAMGGNVEVRGEVLGDATAMGGNVEVYGEVRGDAEAVGGNVRVASTGHIRGDAEAVGGNVEVQPGGRIDGRRSALGGATISARIAKAVAWRSRHRDSPAREFFSGTFFKLAGGIAFFVLALLLSMFARDRLNVVAEEIKTNPLKSMGIGALCWIIVPVSAIVMFVTCIGIPVAAIEVLLAAFAGFAGMTAVALLVGERLPFLRRNRTPLATLALGCAAVTIVWMIPFVGQLVMFVVGTLAFGAVIRTKFARPATSGPAAPPPLAGEPATP